jgi:hypothetical protein
MMIMADSCLKERLHLWWGNKEVMRLFYSVVITVRLAEAPGIKEVGISYIYIFC